MTSTLRSSIKPRSIVKRTLIFNQFTRFTVHVHSSTHFLDDVVYLYLHKLSDDIIFKIYGKHFVSRKEIIVQYRWTLSFRKRNKLHLTKIKLTFFSLSSRLCSKSHKFENSESGDRNFLCGFAEGRWEEWNLWSGKSKATVKK